MSNTTIAPWQRHARIVLVAVLALGAGACQRAYYGAMEKFGFAFRDRVLYLKHNLNARAIASLRADRAKVEADIGALVADMNRSIREADAFIKDMAPKKD